MCIVKTERLAVISLLCFCLAGCGADIVGVSPASPVVPSPATTPPTTLDGNWLLAGSRVPATYPVLSTSLFVQGKTIFGSFAVTTQCTSSGLIGTSSSGFALNGSIADDGSFQATSGTIGGVGTLGSVSVALRGSSPLPSSPSRWTGTYTIVSAAGLGGMSCGGTQTADFVASSIAPLSGTYIGVLANPLSLPGPFGAGAVVTMQIAQGMPTLVTRSNTMSYPIPLIGSLMIANSACALSVSTVGSPGPSTISGDRFDMIFEMTASHGGVLSGTLDDASARTFSAELSSLAIANGCSGSLAYYNFVRQ